MSARLMTVYPDQDVYHALSAMEGGQDDVLPVVSRDRARRWLGMLTRDRVFEAVRGRLEATHDHVLREHSGLAAIGQEAQFQQLVMGIPPQQADVIQRLLVPLQAVGQSLRQADFRRNFHALVIAIEQPDGSIQCPPDLDAPLHTAQRLVAIVTRHDADAPGGGQPPREV
jgi:K+/H+ antiporter YhaU regulatory subunit KhtT